MHTACWPAAHAHARAWHAEPTPRSPLTVRAVVPIANGRPLPAFPDSVFSNISNGLGIVGFVALRWSRPDAVRPFLAPWGKPGAVLLALPQMAVILLSIVSLGASGARVVLSRTRLIGGDNESGAYSVASHPADRWAVYHSHAHPRTLSHAYTVHLL